MSVELGKVVADSEVEEDKVPVAELWVLDVSEELVEGRGVLVDDGVAGVEELDAVDPALDIEGAAVDEDSVRPDMTLDSTDRAALEPLIGTVTDVIVPYGAIKFEELVGDVAELLEIGLTNAGPG
ncbi:hypothetical protein B0A55_05357 [Friedmanniomyces simplex]|uniref:Uncharacterized protein n=1 Tax=Friedmanniomyces simplex TaxID=329884 RepID=A0A4U0X8J0_9PEZI|nr:hypothetical protein B0A55_05357 [Friedmanniomyces simplex]